MEKDFQAWQDLWQGQSTKPIDTTRLIAFMNKNVLKMRRERWGIAISFGATTIFLITMGALFGDIKTHIGLGLIIFAMAMIFALVFRRKLPQASSDDQLSNLEYLNNSIQYLEDQKAITSKYMWWYAVLLIAGLNLTQIDPVRSFGFPTAVNWSLHLGFSLFMLLFFYISIRKREREYQGDLAANLKILQKLEQQLKKNSR